MIGKNPMAAEKVGGLSWAEREDRMETLVVESRQIATEALEFHLGGHELAATAILFSGGNDSTVLAHMFREQAEVAIHANTTVGIEDTRVFVRETCASWGLTLMERTAPVSYRDLVLDQGFPGPGMHFKMYQRLKERCLREARRELVANPRKERVLFLAGRRRSESARRASVPLHEREGSIIWASPLAFWTKLDMNTYRKVRGDVPENAVSGLLHMSGECLCGAFAKPGELDEIGMFYPDFKAEMEALEAEVRAKGMPERKCRWGSAAGKPEAGGRSGPLCSSCDERFFDLFEGDTT